jgi:hypothetical protein
MLVKFDTKLEALTKFLCLISISRNDTVSPIECLTLASIILLPPKYKYSPLSTRARQYLQSTLQMSPQLLNNHIYKLTKAKYLYRDEDSLLQITPYFRRLHSQPLTLNVTFTSNTDSPPDNIQDLRVNLGSTLNRGKNSIPTLQVDSESPELSNSDQD